MSMINKEVSDFSVQSYQNGEFKTVTKADIFFTGYRKPAECGIFQNGGEPAA